MISVRFFSTFWVLLLSCLFAIYSCQSTKTALKAMEDQEWDKAEEALFKQLDNPKDSLHADVYYAYSLLYSDSAYTQYDVDTAYHFVLLATQDFEITPLKEKEKLFRTIPLNDTILLAQKRRLDSLVFLEAKLQSTVTAYQSFLDRHTDAPQQEDAVSLRNEVAFKAAQQMDNYQAYREFMNTYPEAEQYDQAEERFNTLVFQAQTKTGNLASYYQFLDAFPQSPYRPQAEQSIYSITTASNNLSSYAKFARDFPQSPLTRSAVNWVYHLYQENSPADSFSIAFPDLPFQDSLQLAHEVASKFLLPYLDEEFGFINTSGETEISPQFSKVPQGYLCDGVRSSLIFAINNRFFQTLTKNGELLYSLKIEDDEFEEVQELGGGLFWVGLSNSGMLIHASGEVVISPEENVAAVELLPGYETPYQFVKYQVSDQWGLKTFTGTTLLPPSYDDITDYGKFVALEKEGKLAITNPNTLANQVVDPSFEANFQYEDVTLLDENYLIAYTEDYETVLDTTLAAVVPLEKHTVLHRVSPHRVSPHRVSLNRDSLSSEDLFLLRTSEERQEVQGDSLITQQSFRYSLYPNATTDLPNSFSQAYYNDRWLALKHDQSYHLLDTDSSQFSSITYDSIKVLSDHFALIFPKNSNFTGRAQLLIADQPSVSIPYELGSGESITIRLLRAQREFSPNSVEESILIDSPTQPSLVITQTGDTVLYSDVDGIRAYTEDIYVVEKGNKQGIVDRQGNELVPVRYERIGNYQSDGLISLFDRQKFGVYHPQTGVIIEPTYESTLQYYSVVLQDSVPVPLYIARENGKFGIVNSEGALLLPFAFQTIRYWNEQAALVRYDDQWHIYRLEESPQRRLVLDENAFQYSNISEFTVLPSTNAETLIKIYKEGNYGLLGSQQGEILSPTFDDIRPLSYSEESLYITEKYVKEAKLYILIYMNAQGEIIFRKAYDPETYDRLYCEE